MWIDNNNNNDDNNNYTTNDNDIDKIIIMIKIIDKLNDHENDNWINEI